MTKDEFLRILRGKITKAMEQSEVEAQIAYYSSYIDELMATGKSESEAVEELGDPLLIAKTLDNAVEGGYLDSDYQGGSHAKQPGGSTQSGRGETYEKNTYHSTGQSGAQSSRTEGGGYQRQENPGSYGTGGYGNTSGGGEQNTKDKVKRIAIMVAGIVAILACIYLFISACFGIGSCIIGGFLPILLIVLIIGALFSLFRRF